MISTMVLYAETMLIPAIPHLIRDFGINYSTSSWILSAYLISGAISVPIAGRISDMYGRKKILLVIMGIYTTGVIGGSVSSDIYSMIISRTIQGIGMSVFPIVFAIVQDQFPKNKIAIAQGTLASMFAFGGVLGLLAGGYIIEYFGWRVTFYSVIPISILLMITIQRYIYVREQYKNTLIPLHDSQSKINLKEQRKKYHRITSELDIKGILVLAVTIVAFLSSITLLRSSENANSDIWHLPAEFTFLIIVGFFSLVVFIFIEKKSSTPLINLKLVSKNPIWITNTIVIIWGICTFAIFQSIPVLVQNPLPFGLGGSAIDAANIQLPFSISSLIFGPTSGFIISKIGAKKVMRIGAAILTIGLFAIFAFHNDAINISINLAIVGVGLSLLNVGQINITTTSVPFKFIGVSLGINTLIRYIGSAIGPAVAGLIMQSHLKIDSAIDMGTKSFPARESYDYIFLFIFVLSAITIVLSLMIKKNQKNI